ncbi:MAG: histidine phosphatase family protein [Rhodospirillales bacterium]|jgi:broad specificity phosphatase PhoE|nr:histidine phosphatase family protein [Rhodospirillales bacterium]
MQIPTTRVVFIRHGPTAWNAEKRIQGRVDTSLSAEGRVFVATWRIPDEFAGFKWYSSNKKRAIETARIMGLDPIAEPLLAEMNWGEWEGRIIGELRAEYGEDMAANERRGLDFRPPGGESPRDVQKRVAGWIKATAQGGQPLGAVVHAGVIRTIYCLASGWDMTGKPPVKLLDGTAHLFDVDTGGMPSVSRLNIPLTGA